jgi:hypothetical protein
MKGLVSFLAQIRFHPLNTLSTVPSYELAIGPGGSAALMPLETTTTPEYSQADPNQIRSLVGARLEAGLIAAGIGRATRPVGVLLEGKELARVSIDFARIE